MDRELYLFLFDHLVSYIIDTHVYMHSSALVHKWKHVISLWLCACGIRPKIKAQHYVLPQHLGEPEEPRTALLWVLLPTLVPLMRCPTQTTLHFMGSKHSPRLSLSILEFPCPVSLRNYSDRPVTVSHWNQWVLSPLNIESLPPTLPGC